MCPMIEPLAGNWLSFKDFKDAAPLVRAFYNTVTHPIAETFSGRLAELEKAGEKIGGYAPADALSYDLSMLFDALPNIPFFSPSLRACEPEATIPMFHSVSSA